jgi:hypothetical protein
MKDVKSMKPEAHAESRSRGERREDRVHGMRGVADRKREIER